MQIWILVGLVEIVSAFGAIYFLIKAHAEDGKPRNEVNAGRLAAFATMTLLCFVVALLAPWYPAVATILRSNATTSTAPK